MVQCSKLLSGLGSGKIVGKKEKIAADSLKRRSKRKNLYLRQSAAVQLNLRSKKTNVLCRLFKLIPGLR